MLKKAIYILIIYIFFFKNINSQNIAITDDDTYTANSSAMLDVKSLTKGMLVPRLTSVQRNAISNPATGLLVFDTDFLSFYYFNGTQWINLATGNTSNIIGYTSPDKVYLSDVNDKFGIGTVSPIGKLEVKSDLSVGIEKPIFNVVNSTGDTVFAVYEQGVRVNVYDDPLTKTSGSKGGFAVGGFSPNKSITNEYLRITPDSVRIYIEEGNPAKTSGSKGGFAVGGFSPNKIMPTDYFNIYGSQSAITVPTMVARIFWYPLKEAFLAGKVIVESADSVGLNSFSTGYLSRAKGNYSQAFGYQSIARGNYSTAIGKNAIATRQNSFAIGDGARVYADDAYAIGAGARAFGAGSYAIGSMSRDSSGAPGVDVTLAQGDFSFAIGQGAKSLGLGSMTYGVNSIATGDFSFAAGENAYANAFGMVALGRNNFYKVSYSANVWNPLDPIFVIGNGHFNYRTNALTLLKNGKIGFGVNEPNYDLELNPNGNRIIGMSMTENSTLQNGNSLTLMAGSAKNLSSDKDGGELLLKSGASRGSGSSFVSFHTAKAGVVGSIEQQPNEKMRLTGDGFLGLGNSNPNSTFTNSGSISMPIRTVVSNTTLDFNDYTVLANANITISLPSAINCNGRIYIIKKTTALPGNVTIDPEGVQTIDGSLTKTISAQWETIVIQSNGAVWYKIN